MKSASIRFTMCNVQIDVLDFIYLNSGIHDTIVKISCRQHKFWSQFGVKKAEVFNIFYTFERDLWKWKIIIKPFLSQGNVFICKILHLLRLGEHTHNDKIVESTTKWLVSFKRKMLLSDTLPWYLGRNYYTSKYHTSQRRLHLTYKWFFFSDCKIRSSSVDLYLYCSKRTFLYELWLGC